MKKHNITRKQLNAKNCFVCGLDNPYGLKTRFYETDEKELIGVFSTKNGHQSYPGRLHGGVISAILDETIGRAVCIDQGDNVWGVTIDLNIKYKKAVPLGCELKAVGRVTSDSSRFFEGSGELMLPDGSIAATATGRYMKLSIDYISGDSGFVEEEWGLPDDMETPATIDI